MKKLIIFGNSDFAQLVTYYLEKQYDIVAYCVDNEYILGNSFMEKPLVSLENVKEIYPPNEYCMFVAIGYHKMNTIREEKFKYLKELGYSFATYIHPSAVISESASVGQNCMIFENSVMQSYSVLNDSCIMFANSTICHHSVVDPFCFIASNACINGYVNIKNNSFIGAGAVIRDKITIGHHNLIGAGCVIQEDSSPFMVYKNTLSAKEQGEYKMPSKIKRIALYSFYDAQGIVDDYVIFQLKSFRVYFEEIHVVVNGFLQEESKIKLKSIVDGILIRENVGFDAWGYKKLIEKLGYNKLAEYDEVICFNHTCYGPIFPVDAMFSKMAVEDCDFWGLYFSKAPKAKIYNQGKHIPSYFVAYKKTLVKSSAFKEFWDNLPELNTYNDAVKLYEQAQTPFFELKGFKVRTVFDFKKYENISEWWFIEKQAEILINDKLPLLKRRPFFKNKKGRINGSFYRKVIPFLKENTSYDTNLIYENLKRTQDILNIKKENIFNIFYWKVLALLGNEKYKNRLKNMITSSEVKNIFGIFEN